MQWAIKQVKDVTQYLQGLGLLMLLGCRRNVFKKVVLLIWLVYQILTKRTSVCTVANHGWYYRDDRTLSQHAWKLDV